MLNLKKFFVTENDFEYLVERLEKRQISRNHLLFIREKWKKCREIKKNIEDWQHKANQLEGTENSEEVKKIKVETTGLKDQLEVLNKELKDLTDNLPNLPSFNTPQENNKIIDKTEYQIALQHHLSYEKILKKLALINEEKSILLSGSKFTVYQGFGTQLLHALINFMLTENSKRGYQLFTTPYLVNDYNLYNTGQFHKFQDSLYKVEESNLYLLPTAEVSLVNLYQKQILTEEELPLSLCAYSPCFRAERIAAGQKNKGLVRLHQFHKVELVKIVKPENSYLELEKLVADARHLLHLLKISHRVIEVNQKELGFSATKQYDIEVWLPVSQEWLEISSCSNCEDFQSRRAKMRVKVRQPSQQMQGDKYSPHTLNGSALAIDRLIIALCEYYYQERENKIEIPEALKKYFF